jgi:hypothetical protein
MENVIGTNQVVETGSTGRSVAAVVAGFVFIVVTHTATDAVMHATGVFPKAGEVMGGGLFALAATYRLAFEVLGAALTARLAPRRPMKHALVLGAIGTVAALAGLLATLGRGPELGPLWYPLVLVLTSVPCCWLGAKLAKSRA